ncbi:hypothetical protein BKA70DRAFT_1421295 [Coprinopsis sp. MPI-PUGE-AT-0042]|nr:hypothetical protein BKA70DRAFT_1421295 [Coprinopsis sp. MPI-PUGE-AT-0042]
MKRGTRGRSRTKAPLPPVSTHNEDKVDFSSVEDDDGSALGRYIDLTNLAASSSRLGDIAASSSHLDDIAGSPVHHLNDELFSARSPSPARTIRPYNPLPLPVVNPPFQQLQPNRPTASVTSTSGLSPPGRSLG